MKRNGSDLQTLMKSCAIPLEGAARSHHLYLLFAVCSINVVWLRFKCLFHGSNAIRSAAGKGIRPVYPALEDTEKIRFYAAPTFLHSYIFFAG